MVYSDLNPRHQKKCLDYCMQNVMWGVDDALDLTTIDPLTAEDVLNSTINTRGDTHVLYASYI